MFPVRIWPQPPSPQWRYSVASSGPGMPRLEGSFASHKHNRSDMAPFKKRLGATLLEKGNSNGLPNGVASVVDDTYLSGAMVACEFLVAGDGVIGIRDECLTIWRILQTQHNGGGSHI